MYADLSLVHDALKDAVEKSRAKVQEWKYDYNHRRPHESLGYLPPKALLPDNVTTPETSNVGHSK